MTGERMNVMTGKIRLTMVLDNYGSTGVRIDRADSQASISEELLAEIQKGMCYPSYPARLFGDLLVIKGVNRTVTYHVGEYNAAMRCYLMTLADNPPACPVYRLIVVPWGEHRKAGS